MRTRRLSAPILLVAAFLLIAIAIVRKNAAAEPGDD